MSVIQELIGKNLKSYLETIEGHEFQKNMTLCPFHDDSKPSMSVDNKNGADVWYCHPCEIGGNIIHYVMRKHDLKKGQAIKKLADHFNIETTPVKPKIIAEYSYTDEKGKELYKILRLSPKDFTANKKLNGIRQVLYHMPEVFKSETVWILEGEKDADNVRKLGLVATTAPFGMVNWKPEFSRSLKNKKVIICLDVGTEKEAGKRAASILKAGASNVKCVELPGLEKEGEDISDWIENHDSQTNEDLRAQLERIADETPEFELPSDKLKVKNSFLNSYIESITDVTDAPETFILFSALGLLSGICNKFYFYYPRKTPLNLYMLLLAPSTFYRKSVTIDIASDYLSAVNDELLFPESFTSEAFIEILSKRSRGLLTWRELIQVKEFQFGSEYNRGLPSLLTDLFDHKPKIRRYTKGEGETVVESPTVSILAAGISTWLVDHLKEIDFQGGIWTRFLFVPVEEKESRKFRRPKRFILNPAIEKKLKALDTMEERMMDLERVFPLLDRWGERHQKQAMRLDNELLKATFQRLEVALLKIACLLQLAENGKTAVEPQTFNDAVRIIEYLKKILPTFFEEQIVFTASDRNRIKILQYIKRKQEVGRTELIRYSHLEARLLDKILDQLSAEDAIGTKSSSTAGRSAKIYYWKNGLTNAF